MYLHIKKEAKGLAKDNGGYGLYILISVMKYRSQNCTEEAAIVDKLIFEEEDDAVHEHDEIISDGSGLQRKYTLQLDY